MLVDSHCHFNLEDLKTDIPQFINNAKDVGVSLFQTICTSFDEFGDILKIANSHQSVFCSVGLHPNNVADDNMLSAAQIIALCQNDKVIGIGETGLDYYRDTANRDLQRQSFIEHIKAAQETGLPVIVHTREADEDTVAILKDLMQQKPFKALIHCFSASRWLAEECLEMGIYISLSGIITFKNAQEIRDIAKDVPLEMLLVETDAPYLAPVPKRGKSNEPAFVRYTAEALAELKGMSYAKIADKTTENFLNLFSKVSDNA